MRHIKNYAKVKAEMKTYQERQMAILKSDLDEAIASKQTPETIARYQASYDKTMPKENSEWMARLEAADRAPKLLEINIRVTWSKSRVGEFNARAEAFVCVEDVQYGTRSAHGIGRAGGCGYDKRSAAVDEALEFKRKKDDDAYAKESKAIVRAALDRFVIEHGEDLWKEYAIARKPFPHLCFGGKGMSTITRLFQQVGCRPYRTYPVRDFVIDYVETDNGSDVYHIIRKGRI